MKIAWTLERRPADEVRALWIAAVFVLAFGLHTVQSRYEPAITSANARAEAYYTGMVANERLVREAAMLHRAEHAAFADLRHVSRDASLSSGTAALIEYLSSISRATGVQLVSLQPETDSSNGGMPSTAVTIAVRGRFPSVLQFIADLSHGGTLLQVNGAHVSPAASAEKRGNEPLLDAAVSATLYRPRMPGEEGSLHASAR